MFFCNITKLDGPFIFSLVEVDRQGAKSVSSSPKISLPDYLILKQSDKQKLLYGKLVAMFRCL